MPYSHLYGRRRTWRSKAHTDLVTSGSALLYCYSACLCSDLFKSLFKGCVFPCLWGTQALQEQPAEWTHPSSPRSDLQSHCIERTVFITALHTNLLYLLHGEHNPSSNSSAPPLSALKSLLGTTGWWDLWEGSLSLGCFERWKWYSGATESLISLWYVYTGQFETQW